MTKPSTSAGPLFVNVSMPATSIATYEGLDIAKRINPHSLDDGAGWSPTGLARIRRPTQLAKEARATPGPDGWHRSNNHSPMLRRRAELIQIDEACPLPWC
jgi:hypothetical protein